MTEPPSYTHAYRPPPGDQRPPAVPWWATVVIAAATFVAGIVVGIVLLLTLGDEFEEAVEDFTDPFLTAGSGGDVEELDAAVGDCFEGAVNVSVESVGARVPCDAPHQLEVFARFDAPVGTDGEPGRYDEHDMEYFADDGCHLAFEYYVGEDYETSDFDYTPVVPTQIDWRAGGRTVHCLIFDPLSDRALTSSVKAANR